MYIPKHFVETDANKLHDVIEQFSFATIVSAVDRVPMVTHMPLLLDRDRGDLGTLIGHFAAANQHALLLEATDALAIFHGPHAYISPSWYQSPKTVPTWNYVAVHASGRPRRIRNEAAVLQVVTRYVDTYEARLPQPWKLEAEDGEFVQKLLKRIVGFEIEITALEGKFKLNQNHDSTRRERVIAALRQQGDENSVSVAQLMSQPD